VPRDDAIQGTQEALELRSLGEREQRRQQVNIPGFREQMVKEDALL